MFTAVNIISQNYLQFIFLFLTLLPCNSVGCVTLHLFLTTVIWERPCVCVIGNKKLYSLLTKLRKFTIQQRLPSEFVWSEYSNQQLRKSTHLLDVFKIGLILLLLLVFPRSHIYSTSNITVKNWHLLLYYKCYLRHNVILK